MTENEPVVYVIDDFPEQPYFSDVCNVCVHFFKLDLRDRKCRAFPDRIPNEIWEGTHDHQTPYPGDNGIRFHPVDTPELRKEFPHYFADEGTSG